MKDFFVNLTDASGRKGSARRCLSSHSVSREPIVWDRGRNDDHTVLAEIGFVGRESEVICMDGDAWRSLQIRDCLDDFIRLFFLDRIKAEKVICLAKESDGHYYRSILTRDAGTESCTVWTSTNDMGVVLEQEHSNYVTWERNDNFLTEHAYLGNDSTVVPEQNDVAFVNLITMAQEIVINSLQ